MRHKANLTTRIDVVSLMLMLLAVFAAPQAGAQNVVLTVVLCPS